MRPWWLPAGALLSGLMSGAAWASPVAIEAAEMVCADGVIYPGEAVMYQLEGKTVLEFSLADDGSVVDVAVKRSSGWSMLDEAAVEAISGCRTTLAPEKRPAAKRLPIEYTWSLDRSSAPHTLVPGSCAASDRFAGFRPFDASPSGADGILVRALIRSSGQPYFAKAERGSAPPEAAALAIDYLRTCRFAAPDSGVQSDKTMFGRVLLK